MDKINNMCYNKMRYVLKHVLHFFIGFVLFIFK